MVVGHFLAGIAAVIWSPAGKYLLLHRAPTKDFAPGVWECVTGRIEQGEGYIDALYREMQEEIGTIAVPMVILGTAHFFRGESIAENELLGVVFGCEMSPTYKLSLSSEHDDMRWVTYEEAMHMLSAEDPSTTWLRRVLQRGEVIRRELTPAFTSYFRDNSFEMG
jgi:8-oxo-dGTP diphosphatase